MYQSVVGQKQQDEKYEQDCLGAVGVDKADSFHTCVDTHGTTKKHSVRLKAHLIRTQFYYKLNRNFITSDWWLKKFEVDVCETTKK